MVTDGPPMVGGRRSRGADRAARWKELRGDVYAWERDYESKRQELITARRWEALCEMELEALPNVLQRIRMVLPKLLR